MPKQPKNQKLERITIQRITLKGKIRIVESEYMFELKGEKKDKNENFSDYFSIDKTYGLISEAYGGILGCIPPEKTIRFEIDYETEPARLYFEYLSITEKWRQLRRRIIGEIDESNLEEFESLVEKVNSFYR